MGIFGLRLDIFVIIWFLGMGMVNYIDAETGVFALQLTPKHNITKIANWQGVNVDNEEGTADDLIEPRSQPEESSSFRFLDSFIYVYKAATFATGVLWNSTFGLHIYLRDNFNVAFMPWGLPIMILVNLVNFLGILELWTKIKV